MLMKTIPATLVAILLTCGVAFADETNSAPPAPPAPEASTPPAATATTTEQASAEDANDPVICKREPPKVGSRIGGARQVCRKKSEWQKAADAARSMVEDVQSRSSTQNAVPPGGGQ